MDIRPQSCNISVVNMDMASTVHMMLPCTLDMIHLHLTSLSFDVATAPIYIHDSRDTNPNVLDARQRPLLIMAPAMRPIYLLKPQRYPMIYTHRRILLIHLPCR